MLFDVFICHASEDKDGFVRPLAEQLLDIKEPVEILIQRFLKSGFIEAWFRRDEGRKSAS